MHIGLDLDNTLVDFEGVFAPVGVDLGLLPEGARNLSKTEVRALLRAREDGEAEWMRLQGQVYGRYFARARLFPGAGRFLCRARELDVQVSIVSHKTRYGHYDPARVELWGAALDWLEGAGFFSDSGFGVGRECVYFEETREAKIARITAIECDLFIDDLAEVLLHPAFPKRTRGLWFANGTAEAIPGLAAYATWEELSNVLESPLSQPAVRR